MPGSENLTRVMFHFVYVLEGKDSHLYIGVTHDLDKRLKEHNLGQNFSTKPFRPWEIIHYECIP